MAVFPAPGVPVRMYEGMTQLPEVEPIELSAGPPHTMAKDETMAHLAGGQPE
jgi:hypothetical protein